MLHSEFVPDMEILFLIPNGDEFELVWKMHYQIKDPFSIAFPSLVLLDELDYPQIDGNCI